jgi:hypothetical protein
LPVFFPAVPFAFLAGVLVLAGFLPPVPFDFFVDPLAGAARAFDAPCFPEAFFGLFFSFLRVLSDFDVVALDVFAFAMCVPPLEFTSSVRPTGFACAFASTALP